jgi:nicotinate-nucleotide adenylyltransferase
VAVKLGVLGGTFDPIHLGHLLIAEEAREHLGLDTVLFIPTGQPYLRPGSPLASAAHRLAMTRLGVADNPAFDVSGMEVERPGPTYTLDTLEALARERGEGLELFVVLGVDSARTLPRWHEPAQVLARCTPVVVVRPGAGEWDARELDVLCPGVSQRTVHLQGPQLGISGTELRRRIACGSSIRYWVPRPVEEYIAQHKLYQEGAP